MERICAASLAPKVGMASTGARPPLSVTSKTPAMRALMPCTTTTRPASSTICPQRVDHGAKGPAASVHGATPPSVVGASVTVTASTGGARSFGAATSTAPSPAGRVLDSSQPAARRAASRARRRCIAAIVATKRGTFQRPTSAADS